MSTPDPSAPEGLAALRDSYAARVPGWSAPVTWTLVIDGEVSVVNQPGGKHGVSALALAVPLGHDGSTATLPVTAVQVAESLDLLTPAAADTTMRHPNLEAFRTAAAGGHELHAVFVAALSDPVSSDHDAALRAACAPR